MMADNRQKGFTLIELMVAMAISGMLMAVVAMAFSGQSRSNNSVQDVTSLQQDLRSALQLMAGEIRMAGYDPTGKNDPKIGISTITPPTSTEFRFGMDIDGDGVVGANEDIRFAINTNGDLGRETGGAGGLQPIAENIDQLMYQYYLDDGSPNGKWTQTPTTAELKQIRAVKIMILGHSARETAGVADTTTFTPPLVPPDIPPNWTPASPGHFHWRMMSLIVQCRNLSIKA